MIGWGPAVIVCSCNFITLGEIEEVVTGFLGKDEWQLITPGKVYHAMKKRGKCCGCFPNVIDVIIRVTSDYHRAKQTPETDIVFLTEKIRKAHEDTQRMRSLARQSKSRQAA